MTRYPQNLLEPSAMPPASENMSKHYGREDHGADDHQRCDHEVHAASDAFDMDAKEAHGQAISVRVWRVRFFERAGGGQARIPS